MQKNTIARFLYIIILMSQFVLFHSAYCRTLLPINLNNIFRGLEAPVQLREAFGGQAPEQLIDIASRFEGANRISDRILQIRIYNYIIENHAEWLLSNPGNRYEVYYKLGIALNLLGRFERKVERLLVIRGNIFGNVIMHALAAMYENAIQGLQANHLPLPVFDFPYHNGLRYFDMILGDGEILRQSLVGEGRIIFRRAEALHLMGHDREALVVINRIRSEFMKDFEGDDEAIADMDELEEDLRHCIHMHVPVYERIYMGTVQSRVGLFPDLGRSY